jgi:orotidine-5'-phosphate decarboxylase
MPEFAEKFLSLAAERSPLCVGVDPSVELLQQWELSVDAAGVATFCQRVMSAVDGQVAVIKPQAAFFERFGPAGMTELVRLVRTARDQGVLTIIDCKRGDMGPSMEAYAHAFLGSDSAFAADAITVTPYLGFASLVPVLNRAVEVSAGVFIVVRSSNREGNTLQDACLDDGRMVADSLADDITAFNGRLGKTPGPIGAVMGATLDKFAARTLERMPSSLFLAPGIGAQGADFGDVVRNFGAASSRAIPSVSRGILSQGPSVSRLRETIKQHRDRAMTLL